jgi:heat-inducible transcriptional repressor
MSSSPNTPADAPLSDRAQHILRALVESYIRDGEPVGSRTLSRTSGLELSPASIRNVLADLDELGLIVSPHTSAGRVPTVQGYRLFIDTMLKMRPPGDPEVERMRRMLDPEGDAQGLIKAASSMLSSVTQLAGVVTVPKPEVASLRHIEFLALSEQRVLAILVMNDHEVQNRILHLTRPFSASELQQAANCLNELYAGRSLGEVRGALLEELERVRADMDRVMRSALELGGLALSPEERGREGLVLAGEANLMDYAELSDLDKLRQLFAAFSEKREILHLLDKCIHAEGIQIFIGQESGYEVLDDCSVVTAPYTLGGDTVGVLGVIGPTRMAYERVIPIVDITAKLLGAALKSRD